jgi:sulfur carrier protein
MKIEVNGLEREATPDLTVGDLIAELGLDRSACAVEINRELVPHRERSARRLRDGDRVEVVTLVGGG